MTMFRRRRSEAERIGARYRDVVVDIRTALPRADQQVDVVTFDAVLRLAQQSDRDVRRLPDPWTGAALYFVDDGGTRYGYRAAGHRTQRRLVVI